MTDSASITVTNHRLRKAMSNANDDDLKSHAKKVGEELKSELKLRLGEILKIYPYRDKCEVRIKGTSETETCLIAHDILSEGMNVSGFPKGRVTHEKAEEVIIPSETIYGIILDVDIGGKNQKCIVSYINIDRKHTPNNAHKGEYKIQVGKNVISLTDKYININSDNLFINGLPYTEAYKPLVDYPDKEEVGNGLLEIDGKVNDLIGKPVLSLKSSSNNCNVGDTVTITCNCKDMMGNPIPNRKITLMMNGISQGSKTTNENGIVEWEQTYGASGLKDYWVEDVHCIVNVSSFRKIETIHTGGWYVNEETGMSSIIFNTNSNVSIGANGYTVLKTGYERGSPKEGYCPWTSHVCLTNQSNIRIMINYLGEIRAYNYSSSSFNSGFQVTTTFPFKKKIID